MKRQKQSLLSAGFKTFYGSFFFGQIVFFGFMSPIYRSLGYTDTFIGTLISVSSLSGLLMRLVFGWAMDRYHNPRLLIGISYSGYALLIYGLFVFGRNPWYAFLYAAVAGGLNQNVASTADAWVMSMEGDDIDYGKIRGTGSFTYAIAGLAVGRVMDMFGYAAACYVIFAAWLVIMICLTGIPDPAPVAIGGEDGGGASVLGLLKNSNYVVLVLCLSLSAITCLAYDSFYSLVFVDLGGSSLDTGTGLFVSAMSEFVAMSFFSKLSKRINAPALFCVGLVGCAARSLAVAMSPTPALAIAASTLQAISFGFVHPASVICVARVVDPRHKAFALQVSFIGSSVTRMVFSPIAGRVSETLGTAAMMALFGGFSLAAAGVLGVQMLRHREMAKIKG